jgi:Cu2+-exporting ATPase
MSTCKHCGTPFSAGRGDERFCCKGCEFVFELIQDEGLERFYDLRRDTPVRPARSVPFEAHDFGWLDAVVAGAESTVGAGDAAQAEFALEGISCVGCVWLVEKVFLRCGGALEAAAQPATGQLRLRWTAKACDLGGFARELASFGYTLSAARGGAGRGEVGDLGARLGLCGAFAMNAMAFTLPSYLGMPADFAFARIFHLVTFLSATLGMLVGGSYFIRRAWQSARAGIVHIDLPIALGLVLAFGGSLAGWALEVAGLLYFDFVAVFVFLMLAGRFLQLSAVEKNRHRLQRHRPVPETLASPDRAEPLALADLGPGIRFELAPGQSVPVAATLDAGAAEFSLEWISGEADPLTFRAGRPLPAGAIHLGAQPVVLTAAESWHDSLLARLTSNERAAVRVPGLERLLRGYLLVVLVLGVGGFGWWLRHGSLAEALQVMISVFVVSCPCALGVALPLADELSGSLMERAGVFIRESLVWARLRRVRTLIFDKTGTLTLERPVLVNPEALDSLSAAATRALAVLTTQSLHPVSRTLLEALGRHGQQLLRDEAAEEVHDVPGAGRHFQAAGRSWSLGRPGWSPDGLAAREVAPGHDAELRCDGEVVARFCFHESLRPDAVAALELLRQRGFRMIILSGDRPEKVAAAAKLLGVAAEDAHASLSPVDKQERVKAIDRENTLFLGDGANDSLAFNEAWTTGTPVVDRSLLESKADFFFLGQGLRFLPRMLALAIRRQQVVRRAFSFALVYNLSVIGVALSGHMSPLLAAILMPLSSIISLAIVASGLQERAPKVPRVAQEPGGAAAELPHGRIITAVKR